MDFKLALSTFVAVFVAELGDKTQLATLSLASEGKSRWMVFLGSALALVTTSAIAVLGGEIVARAIPPVWIRRAAGTVFIVMGVLFWPAASESRRHARWIAAVRERKLPTGLKKRWHESSRSMEFSRFPICETALIHCSNICQLHINTSQFRNTCRCNRR